MAYNACLARHGPKANNIGAAHPGGPASQRESGGAAWRGRRATPRALARQSPRDQRGHGRVHMEFHVNEPTLRGAGRPARRARRQGPRKAEAPRSHPRAEGGSARGNRVCARPMSATTRKPQYFAAERRPAPLGQPAGRQFPVRAWLCGSAAVRPCRLYMQSAAVSAVTHVTRRASRGTRRVGTWPRPRRTSQADPRPVGSQICRAESRLTFRGISLTDRQPVPIVGGRDDGHRIRLRHILVSKRSIPNPAGFSIASAYG